MRKMKKASNILASLGLLAAISTGSASAETFTFTSSSFPDNGLMDSKYAGKGGPRNCDGENISPQLSWSNPPEGTKSFAIVVTDAVGQHGLGVDHWVAYGIPASTTSIPEGGGSQPPTSFVGGLNIIKKDFYLGPCPDVGDAPHHYEFMLVATSLAPDALKPGLTRPEFFEAMKDYGITATSFVGRYARNK